jgi:hypothetical protein
MTLRKLKKSDTLEIRLTHADKSAFMAKAAGEGQSASEVVRLLVDHYLSNSNCVLQELSARNTSFARMALDAGAVLVISILGYGLAAWALRMALLKPFIPSRIGLWKLPDSFDPLTFSIGHRSVPPGAHELLGWWIIPIFLILGATVGLITWRFGTSRAGRILHFWTAPGSR